MQEQNICKYIIYEKQPPIAFITLNRPEKINALSAELQEEVCEALRDAGYDDSEIRVIVIKGSGRGFSAGFDLSTAEDLDAVSQRNRFLEGKGFSANGWWDLFWGNPKPIIAQVHGYCVAGGCATASFCDLCICSEDALFGAPEIRFSGPYLPAIWPWILGMRKARELLYTGNLIGANEAHRLGLVNKVVPRERLDEEVRNMAMTIAKVPAVVNAYNKKLVNMTYEMMHIRLAMERSVELEAACLASPHSIPEIGEFQEITKEKGLNAALAWNSERFALEDEWFKNKGPKK
jgi:enoyl-CoA hydratase